MSDTSENTPAGAIDQVVEVIREKLAEKTELKGRVYHAEALKGASAPFVFWLQTGEEYEETLDGPTDLEEATLEINARGVTKAAGMQALADDISGKVRDAIFDLQGQTQGGILFERLVITMISPVINEHEVNLYRKVYEVSINYQEE